MLLGSWGAKGIVDEKVRWGEGEAYADCTGGRGMRRDEKERAGECAATKVLKDFGLSAGHGTVKAAALREKAPFEAQGKQGKQAAALQNSLQVENILLGNEDFS
jgi:hypothetical protein